MSTTITTEVSLDNELRPLGKLESLQGTQDTGHVLGAFPVDAPSTVTVKKARTSIIILQVSLINFLTSMSTGLIVVGLPRIALDLNLPQKLYLWPSSVYGLTAGSTLLLAGAIADVVGARAVDLVGCGLLGIFTLACGFSRTGIQLVLFRAFQGVASSMHLPCSVSLVTQYVPSGRRRNIGFACLGLSQPLGFSVGLVIGGVLVDTVGWRVGFYVLGGVILLQAIAGWKIIPADAKTENILHKLKHDIDWVGACIACAALATFSYVLAVCSADSDSIKSTGAIVPLVISVLLMVAFPVWMRWQEKTARPVLVPNSLWKNMSFASICGLVVITWGIVNGMELFSSLYFQEVQEVSALQASLRLLPSVIVGASLNLATGYIIDKAPTFWLMLGATIVTAIAPLLMALISPHLSYWKGAFFAQALFPFSADVLFTVGLIVISEVFPEKTQALAGAVFNTVAYFGVSLGLNLMQIVSTLVTEGTQYRDKASPSALLQGYRATFWTIFAGTLSCAVICVLGLRNVGQIGLKRD